MPRHSSKTENIELPRSQERAIKVERESFWQATKRVLLDRRTQTILGLLLLTFAVLAALGPAGHRGLPYPAEHGVQEKERPGRSG